MSRFFLVWLIFIYFFSPVGQIGKVGNYFSNLKILHSHSRNNKNLLFTDLSRMTWSSSTNVWNAIWILVINNSVKVIETNVTWAHKIFYNCWEWFWMINARRISQCRITWTNIMSRRLTRVAILSLETDRQSEYFK